MGFLVKLLLHMFAMGIVRKGFFVVAENKPVKLKRAVIKEELVVLTGDFKKAIVLNQMIYWSERVNDYDKFIADEIERSHRAMGREEIEQSEKIEEVEDAFKTHGWIYKTAEDLSEETMMGVAKSTMGTYINELVDKKWLDKRKNPKWKGDNTFQYRVDILKVQRDLFKLGYALEGYKLLPNLVETNDETPEFENETPSSEIEPEGSEIKSTVRKSNNQFGNQTTLPEITSETTSNNVSSIVNKEQAEDEFINICNEYYGDFAPGRWSKKQWLTIVDKYVTELIDNEKHIEVPQKKMECVYL